MIDLLKFAGVFILVVIGISAIVLSLEDWSRSYQCSSYAEVTGNDTKYVVFDACYVDTESGWMRYSEYIAHWSAHEGHRHKYN